MGSSVNIPNVLIITQRYLYITELDLLLLYPLDHPAKHPDQSMLVSTDWKFDMPTLALSVLRKTTFHLNTAVSSSYGCNWW